MPSSLSQATLRKLRDFKLSGISRTLPVRLEEAVSRNLSHSEFLDLLLEDEVNQRTENRRKRLYGSARLPFEKGFEDFDFTFQPSVKKAEMLELSTCNFIGKRENVIFIGQPGTGKTHLSVALGLKALGYGHTVLFTTVWDMITTLEQSRADLSYHKKVQSYLKPDLLILDELGYKSLAETTVEDFFEIVSKRYEKGSIIITSNRIFGEWDKIFIDKTLTGAILDRLVHHCHIVTIKGESYRVNHRNKTG
ncbi:MAG: IstB domain protein ATP-binding protein [Parcubacteria group bacterium GW2011_GWC2_39_14]|nr:MAG: IstB domain protein ATP-binding protein [Parcubacteria group bacterium GW2011_GWC2_39_14]